MTETPGQRVDRWQAEVMAGAHLMLGVATTSEGATLRDADRDAFDAGVHAGMSAMVVVLDREGWLRSPEESE